MEVEAFLDEFQSKRKLAHLRRIKADKMSELLNVNNQRGGSQVATNASWNPSAGGLYGNHLPRQIQPCGHRM